MSAPGAFTFVLHGHQPFLRQDGRLALGHHAEEWLHDAIIETYIPLLETLYDLSEEGVDFRFALGVSPVLAEQLADPLVLEHFERYLDERIEAAQNDMLYFEREAYNDHLRFLAEWYRDGFERIKTAFNERFGRDLIGALRRLQDEGFLEILTTAASHAYLPLLGSDASLNAQVKTAVASYRRLFGRAPTTFWLPEYGYRPARVTQNGQARAGIEEILAANGISTLLVDTHSLTGAYPTGTGAGNVLGTYSGIKRRYVLPNLDYFVEGKRDASPFAAYRSADTTVAALARSERVGQQVWGSELGYPLDFDYREISRRAGTSGLAYWRVTGAKVDAANKDTYHPDWAAYKIEQHAEHFAHLVGDQLRSYNQATGQYGLVTAAFNANQFGHWWFEGIQWLGKVLRHLSSNPEIDVTTPSAFVKEHPPKASINLREGSWGFGGMHFVWDNRENHWMWAAIRSAETRMEQIAEHFATPGAAEAVVLAQAARELLLLQSSDWQSLITTDQGRAVAIRRFNEHAERFTQLADSLESGQPDVEAAQAWSQADNVFADVDYRWFSERKD
ncbi:MAG: 1,4-alpha-glucan branching protein domain-containing protein [Anaerolineae bacterium]